MDTTILKKIGLTESQSKAYLALIEHGALSPSELAEKTDETRTNAYAIVDRLVALGLIHKQDGTKNTYAPESPTKLKQLLVNRQKELKATDNELSGVLPQLLSAYTLAANRPGILYLEGVESLRQIYDDIIRTGETIRIFPSAQDRANSTTSAMIDAQISRQRAAGIKTEVLLRQEVLKNVQNDELFEARLSPLGQLDAQIILYGHNIAITTFGESVVTTVITSKEASATLQMLFDVLWNRV